MNDDEPRDLSRRKALTGAAWTLPVITAAALVPTAAAVSQPVEGTEPCIKAEVRTTTGGRSTSTGDLRIEALCDDIPSTDSITVIIGPATSAGRLFQVQRGGSQNFLVSTGNATSSTVKTLTFNRQVRAGDVGFLNWNFSGYTGVQGRVTITVIHGDHVVTVWRNPHGEW